MHPIDDLGIVKVETLTRISQRPENPPLMCHPVAAHPRASGQDGSKMSFSIAMPPTARVVEEQSLVLTSMVIDVEGSSLCRYHPAHCHQVMVAA